MKQDITMSEKALFSKLKTQRILEIYLNDILFTPFSIKEYANV